MAILGVSITKRDTWEGNSEEFSNVYNYETSPDAGDDILLPGISDSDATTLVETIADLERPLHASTTDFVRGRVWGPVDGTQEENQTIAQVDLTGTGEHSIAGGSSMEDCILVRMRTGRRSVRDRPVWLRKWYRTFGPPVGGSTTWSPNTLARRDPLPQEDRDAVAATMRDLVSLTLIELTSFPDRLVLVSPSGRALPDYEDVAMEVYPYLQTHDVKY
jgi:hypothetical protein